MDVSYFQRLQIVFSDIVQWHTEFCFDVTCNINAITARIHQIMQILNDCGLKSTYHANCVLRSVSIEFLRDICERVTEAKAPSDFLSPEEPLNGTTSDEEIERQSAKRLE